MGFLGAVYEWGGTKRSPSLSHISYNVETWHSYNLPKEDSKNIWITWHTHWVLLTSAFSHLKSANFAIPRNIARYRLHFGTLFLILLIFFESLKIVLINMVTILMMSAKMATPGLLKITVFWNKGYDVIISVHDVTNKILSRDSNYIIDVVMWPKFGNSSISMRKVIITSILWEFDKKIRFFWWVVLVQVQ